MAFGNRFKGATITEYAFIGVLIMAVCVTAVFTLGGNLNAALGGLKADLQSNINSAQVAHAATSGNSQVPTGPMPDGFGTIPPPGAGQEQICYQSGWCVNIPVVSGNSATTGSLGGELTHQFADVLHQIVQQLQASGGDPTLIADMTKLAQYGHWLGDDHVSIDGFFTGYPPDSNGVYPPYLVDYIKAQYADPNTNVDNIYNAFNNELASINAFLNQNPNALPPEMRAIVNSQAQQIQNIQNTYVERYEIHNAAQQYMGQGMTEAEAYSKAFHDYENTVANMTNGNGGAVTHQSANTICNNGGDTGVCLRP